MFDNGKEITLDIFGPSRSDSSALDGDIRYPCTISRARARAQQSAYLGLWMDDTCPAPAPPTFQSGMANPT